MIKRICELEVVKKILFFSLMIGAVATLLTNISVLLSIYIRLPFYSFSAVRMLAVAYFEQKPYYVLISFLVCIGMIGAALRIRKGGYVLPGAVFLYYVYNLIILLSVMYESIFIYKDITLELLLRVIVNCIMLFFFGLYFTLIWKQKYRSRDVNK